MQIYSSISRNIHRERERERERERDRERERERDGPSQAVEQEKKKANAIMTEVCRLAWASLGVEGPFGDYGARGCCVGIREVGQ